MTTAVEASRLTSEAPSSGDLSSRLGRGTLYLALFFVSITTLRVGSFTFGDLLLLVSLAFAILTRLAMAGKYRTSPGIVVAVFLILIGGAISTSNAIEPADSLLVIVRIIFLAAFLPWQASVLLPDHSFARRAIGFAAAGGAVTGFGAVAQGFLGVQIPGSYVTEAGRFPGLTQNVSDAGGITSVAVILALFMLVSARGLWPRLWWVLMAGGAGVGLILSGSVSGIVAVGVAAIVLLFRRAIKFRYVLLAGITGVIVLSVTSVVQSSVGALTPLERFQQVLGFTGRYSTSESRLNTYQLAFDQIIQSPLLGAGMDGYSGVVAGGFQAHNILVAALYQGGILVFLGILIALLRPFGSWLKRDRTIMTSYVLSAALGAITFAMTAPSMFNRYLWVPIALLLLMSRLRSRADHQTHGATAAE